MSQIYAQKKITCDTCIRTSLHVQQQKIESSIHSIKNESNALADSNAVKSKKKLTQVVKKEDTSFKNSKAKITAKIDSTARNKYKAKGKEALKKELQPLSAAKTKANNQWTQAKKVLKHPFKLTGEIRSESFAATAQNPMLRNEPVYSRLYIAPTISFLGLPFKANFFLTTENNNTYKSNFFSFKFDANAMRQQAATKIQNEIDEAKKTDRLRQHDIQKNTLETQRYEDELNGMKSKIPDADALQKTLQQQAEEKSKAYLEQERQAAEEKLKNASEEEQLKIKQALKQKEDSIINHYKKEAGDSIMASKSKYGEKMDTSQMNEYKNKAADDTAQLGQYLRMLQKVEDLKAQKQKLNDLRQMDSTKILQKAGGVRNPDDLRKLAKEQLPGNAFLKTVLAVDRFGIGVVNPQYSEFTLYAASVKGLDIGINKDQWFYDLTIGKTTKQFTGPFTSTKPVYDRNIGVARIGYGELKSDHISAEYLYAFDAKSTDINTPQIRNGVLNLNAQFKLFKLTQIEANAAQSVYKESFTTLQTNYVSSTAKTNDALSTNANKAYLLKATHTVSKNAKIEAQIKQTGAAFRTIGNPFLRRNFREFEIKHEQQFFKKKIKFSGFYKEMRDNLIELNKATNRLKGYGLKLSTAFEKFPNLMLSYSPYQQGNNHPDSIYRTNNQFSVTNAMITYKKRYKTIAWNGLVSYTRSAMEINDKGSVAYRLVSTVHTLQMGNRNTSIISYLSNVTAPFVDSLNSNSIQINHTYLATKKTNITLLSEQTKYKNGAYKMGGGMQITSTVFRNFTLSVLARYDKLHKLWHLEDANVFTGRVVMVWKW
ncbi:MAG: hypothetical protein PSX81_09700 [bacterium]|nr:hypothetical protein [bacterium]